MTSGARRRTTALTGVLGGLVLMVAWVLATPVGSSPDEPAHIEYAYGVATGQALPWVEESYVDGAGIPRARISIPTALYDYPATACYQFLSSEPASCDAIENEGTGIEAGSYMVRYPPVYYAVVGMAMRVALKVGLSGAAALLLARVVSGALCVALVLTAYGFLRSRFTLRASLLGMLAACSPVAVYLFGTINPNGFEVASAIAVAGLVAVVRHDVAHQGRLGAGVRTALVIATFCLAWARPLSVAWAGLLMLLLLLPVNGVRPAARLGRATFAALVVVLATAGAWMLYNSQMRTSDVGVGDQWGDSSFLVRILLIVLKFGDLLHQAMSMFGWADTVLPELITYGWLATVAVLVAVQVVGARRGDARLGIAVTFLVAGSAVVAVHSYVSAFGWQGRYWLPVVSAFFVLCIPAMHGRALSAVGGRRLVGAVAGVLAVIMYCALLWNMWRYAYGVGYLEGRFPAVALPTGEALWAPSGGQVTVAVLGAAGILLIVGAIVVAARSTPDVAVPLDPSFRVPAVTSVAGAGSVTDSRLTAAGDAPSDL